MKYFFLLCTYTCFFICKSTRYRIETDFLSNDDNQDFVNDQNSVNNIEDGCTNMKKELMSRREIGDSIIEMCVRYRDRNQCNFALFFWRFLDSEYLDMNKFK